MGSSRELLYTGSEGYFKKRWHMSLNDVANFKRNKLAEQVARMGMPPLRADDGLVELSIQECRAKRRLVIENYPAGRIPKVGDDIKPANKNGEPKDIFVVMEVKHLLVPEETETNRAVVLLVQRKSS
jgi:hypothetical protein